MRVVDADRGAPSTPGKRKAWSRLASRARTVVDPDSPLGLPPALAIVVAAVLGVCVLLRFWTRSPLWLDEALTLNVSRLPLHEIPSWLRHDGAPPLYYFVLHFWVGWFGTSDLAVRSLSGALSLAALPLAWLAGRRLGGRAVAWAAMLLVATSPFAVRYATENRMYALVVLLALGGYLALTSALVRPRAGSLVAIGVTTSLLLYSHYWSIYLLAVVAAIVGWRALHGDRPARLVLVAMGVGALTFVPWLPTFAYQLAHTGTPWAQSASFAAMVHAVAEFAGGDSSPGRALLLVFFALGGLALFGRAVDRRHIDLDLRTRPPARSITVVTFGTLALAILVGLVASSTFQSRYTAVVFPTFILLVAYGLTTMSDRWVRYAVLTVALALGLAGSASNVTTDRTQAGQVAAAVTAGMRPGDVVGYCPDQLGPAVARLLPANLEQVTFPRQTGPRLINWVDYAKATAASNPQAFARYLAGLAGPDHTVWYVWAPGYLTLNGKCEAIATALGALRPGSQELVHYDSTAYYEFDDLVRYPPP